MFKNICLFLVNAVFIFYTLQGFAISPGAGQAQMRNNMEGMQQNKQRMQQHKQNQEMFEQQKLQSNQRPQPRAR